MSTGKPDSLGHELEGQQLDTEKKLGKDLTPEKEVIKVELNELPTELKESLQGAKEELARLTEQFKSSALDDESFKGILVQLKSLFDTWNKGKSGITASIDNFVNDEKKRLQKELNLPDNTNNFKPGDSDKYVAISGAVSEMWSDTRKQVAQISKGIDGLIADVDVVWKQFHPQITRNEVFKSQDFKKAA